MEVKIILRCKKVFGTTQVGETMVLYNNVFDSMTGIAFYSIDRAIWELVDYFEYTGFKDKYGRKFIIKTPSDLNIKIQMTTLLNLNM